MLSAFFTTKHNDFVLVKILKFNFKIKVGYIYIYVYYYYNKC